MIGEVVPLEANKDNSRQVDSLKYVIFVLQILNLNRCFYRIYASASVRLIELCASLMFAVDLNKSVAFASAERLAARRDCEPCEESSTLWLLLDI
jgi:hypothetical protein